MKCHFPFALALFMSCVAGCVNGFSHQQVEIEYFNLSTNEIWITDIEGLPPDATPGRLKPSHAEDQLSASTFACNDTVPVGASIKIVWKENGKQGWPGGLKPNELIPPGMTHEAEFKRDDFGLPAKLKNGKARFTYLGKDKWRIKFFE